MLRGRDPRGALAGYHTGGSYLRLATDGGPFCVCEKRQRGTARGAARIATGTVHQGVKRGSCTPRDLPRLTGAVSPASIVR
jgi:hypothetical protein